MYRRKIRLVAVASVITVVTAALLAIWSTRASERHLDQAQLANRLLVEHLNLSVYSYRLFKQLTDEMLLGTSANQVVVRNKKAAIDVALTNIRELEWKQRLSLGAEAAPNTVEDTDALEELILAIIAEFEDLLLLPNGVPRAERVGIILEEQIDVNFRETVNAALTRQSHIVSAMNNRVERVHNVLIALSIGLAVISLFVASVGGHALIRGISNPLRALQQGANKIEQGDFTHRVPRGFDAEFDEMALAFNSMADRLQQHDATREDNRRQLEEAVASRTAELTELNDALLQSDQLRRQFFADVSHELRTPLTVIRGEAQVALRAQQREVCEYREALQAVLDQAVGLSRLVEDMLFVARNDAQSIRLNRRVCDPQALAQEVVHDLRAVAEVQNTTVQIRPTEKPLTLNADPDRCRQLVMILLENAIRYSPPGSQVTLSWVVQDDTLELLVEDRGYGIDPQDLPHIFDRFFRGYDQSGREVAGTGLGLAVAKAIVEAHGGQITAASEPGAGTQIRAAFPVSS